MKKEIINLPEFLQTLATTDFPSCDNGTLLQISLKTKIICKKLMSEKRLTPIGTNLLNGFSFYLGQMEAELEKRNVFVVDITELINQNQDAVRRLLSEYSFETLVTLADEVDEIASGDKREDSPWQTFRSLIYEEISKRSNRFPCS